MRVHLSFRPIAVKVAQEAAAKVATRTAFYQLVALAVRRVARVHFLIYLQPNDGHTEVIAEVVDSTIFRNRIFVSVIVMIFMIIIMFPMLQDLTNHEDVIRLTMLIWFGGFLMGCAVNLIKLA